MRKFSVIAAAVLIGCLSASVAFVSASRDDDRLGYNGKPIEYWEKQALVSLPQGNFENTMIPVLEKMGPETIPFWLERLQTRDSICTRIHSKLWSGAPARLKAVLPEPIPQRTRRNVAWAVLSHLRFTTNGIPELIQLSYSNDTELRFYAVNLLWQRAYRGYEPSRECIAAFCSALKTGDVQTRLWAVRGLNILPLRREALPALHLALKDSEEEVCVNAAVAITKLEPECDVTSVFKAGLKSSNVNVRTISSAALHMTVEW